MESKPETIEVSKDPSIVQERLNWKLVWRDDAKVAQGLYAGEDIEEMHELSDAGLLDEFFVFLEEMGMMQAFEQMRLPGVKRMLVPTVQCVLLYLLKVLFGGQSMNELPRVLISSLGLMELVGYNARQCEDGLTKRGDAQRTTKKKQGPQRPMPGQNISKPARRRWNDFLTRWQLLAQRGILAAPGGPGRKQTAHPAEQGCGKSQTSGESQRTERSGDGGILGVWVESVGAH
jgi:hypothetical protein